MTIEATLEFDSTFFAVVPGEDEDTNPGIYGKALAQWLVVQLRERGVPAEEALAEDFGWGISIHTKPHGLYVICANDADRSGGWRVVAFAGGGLLARLLGRDKRADALSSVMAAIRGALESTGVAENFREMR